MTSEQLDPLLLRMPDKWRPAKITTENLRAMGITGDTILEAAMSGVAAVQGAPMSMYGGLRVVAGVTVLRHELNPKPDEPDTNADHYVFTQTDHPDAPYLRHGPFTNEKGMARNAGIPHWPDEAALRRFVEGIRDQLQ